MKRLLVFLSVPVILSSCGGAALQEMEKQKKTDAENIAVVEKYIQAVETKDTKMMTNLLSDDYIGYGPSFTDSINKAGAISNWTELSTNLYDKIDYKRTVNIAAKVTDGPHPGDYVSDWANLVISFKDGRGPIQLNMNAVYRIENGKITLSRTFYNEADALRQLGYEFYPPENK